MDCLSYGLNRHGLLSDFLSSDPFVDCDLRRGFAFVSCRYPEIVTACLDLHRIPMWGRTLTVQRPKRYRGSLPSTSTRSWNDLEREYSQRKPPTRQMMPSAQQVSTRYTRSAVLSTIKTNVDKRKQREMVARKGPNVLNLSGGQTADVEKSNGVGQSAATSISVPTKRRRRGGEKNRTPLTNLTSSINSQLNAGAALSLSSAAATTAAAAAAIPIPRRELAPHAYDKYAPPPDSEDEGDYETCGEDGSIVDIEDVDEEVGKANKAARKGVVYDAAIEEAFNPSALVGKSPSDDSNAAGRACVQRTRDCEFSSAYFRQNKETVMSDGELAALVQRMQPALRAYALTGQIDIDGKKLQTPICCVPPEVLKTFFYKDRLLSGGYGSCITFDYVDGSNFLDAVDSGEIRRPEDEREAKMFDQFVVAVRKSMEIVTAYWGRRGVDPMSTNPSVTLFYIV